MSTFLCPLLDRLLCLPYPGHYRGSIRFRVIDGPATIDICLPLPVITPYFNIWGKNVYEQGRAFDHQPDLVPASSTSGSAVVVGQSGFVGLCGAGTGRFHHDGRSTLTVEIPQGGKAWVAEDVAGDLAWRAFNAFLGLAESPDPRCPDFWLVPEYNTWVEQKAAADPRPDAALHDDFVDRLMDRIDALDLPRGKFVIDDGWQHHGWSHMSDWEHHPQRFADMACTADRIARRGFVPGLWLAPALVGQSSRWAHSHPELVEHWTPPDKTWPSGIMRPHPLVERFYEQLLRRVMDWGFRKLKLDLYYGPRRLMIDNLNLFAEIARQLDPGLEIESHTPDPAVSAACAVVRTNDVLVNPGTDWRSVTSAHFRICQWSSPHKIINHDFIGGNDPNVTEADFRSHGLMFAQQPPGRGYACIGLLPDRFSSDTQQWFGRLIRDLHPPTPQPIQGKNHDAPSPSRSPHIDEPSLAGPSHLVR
ncbi:MAG: alpha-amylase family protein [Phycisphaerales bacterium]